MSVRRGGQAIDEGLLAAGFAFDPLGLDDLSVLEPVTDHDPGGEQPHDPRRQTFPTRRSDGEPEGDTLPDDRTQRHLEVAPTPLRGRSLVRAFVGLGGLVTLASLFVIVGAHVVMAQQSFELDRVQEDTRRALRHNLELREQVALASSPAHIIDAAADLGMVRPGDYRTVIVPNLRVTPPRRPATDPTSASSLRTTDPSGPGASPTGDADRTP